MPAHKRQRCRTDAPLRVMEVYAGCGSLALGFQRAGFVLARAFEPDADLRATYAQNVGDWISAAQPHTARFIRHEADLVMGAPPCRVDEVTTPRENDDDDTEDSGTLADTESDKPELRRATGNRDDECIWRFLRVVARVQPLVFVMALPAAAIDHEAWQPLYDDIVHQASASNYQLDGVVLDASRFGVAQTRRTAFVIGRSRGSAALLSAPAPSDDALHIGHNAPTATDTVTAGEVLRRLPPAGIGYNTGLCTARIVPARNPQCRKSAYAGKLFNGAGRPVDLHQPCHALTPYMGGNATPIVDQASIDDPAVTPWYEQWHAARQRNAVPPAMPATVRRLTVAEAAALTGFDQEFVFCGPLTTQFHNVGTAVPPPVAHAVARYVQALFVVVVQ